MMSTLGSETGGSATAAAPDSGARPGRWARACAARRRLSAWARTRRENRPDVWDVLLLDSRDIPEWQRHDVPLDEPSGRRPRAGYLCGPSDALPPCRSER